MAFKITEKCISCGACAAACPAALSGSARSNRRHTARVPPAQVCSYQDRKKQVIVFIRERPKDFSKNPYTKQTV